MVKMSQSPLFAPTAFNFRKSIVILGVAGRPSLSRLGTTTKFAAHSEQQG